MRLSESIRLGALIRPQIIGDLASKNLPEEYKGRMRYGTCALGAAMEGCGERIGAIYRMNDIYMEDDVFTETKYGKEWAAHLSDGIDVLIPCPAGCEHYRSTIPVMIPHLNDLHGWTREKIADWAETLEKPKASVEPEPFEKTVNGSKETEKVPEMVAGKEPVVV